MDNTINWSFSYKEDNSVVVSVYSIKCKSVKYQEVYIPKSEERPFSQQDIEGMNKIRNKLIKRVSKETKNILSDAEQKTVDFIEKHPEKWDLKFIRKYKRDLVYLISRL